jgi:DNA-binding NtrC family response regulator
VARVLVAESDQHIREFFAGILADCGHAVQICADATEATLSLVAKREIDVVVTDLVLEIGDENAFFRDCAALGIPTFTLSGSKFCPGQLSERPAAMLEKPFRFNDVQTVLDAIALQPEPA